MAAIERVLIGSIIKKPTFLNEINENHLSEMSGLKISIRTSTSSLSDYPDWSLDEINSSKKPLVTDGACS